MNEEIRTLIDSLRRGQYEDPVVKIELLSAALREHGSELSLLLTLLRAPQIPLRLAALDICRERQEAELQNELAKLAADTEARVRKKTAEVLEQIHSQIADEALKALLQDDEEEVRVAATKSSSARPEFFNLHASLLENDSDWEVRLAAANALGDQKMPLVAKCWLTALSRDSDSDVQRRCAELLEKRLLTSPDETQAGLPTDIALLAKAETALKELKHQRFPQLKAWITGQTTAGVDPQILSGFGTDLTALAENGTLPRAHCLERSCETVLQLLRREKWRSIALLGTAGTGKSALVNELVHQLRKPENGGWRVLRVSPSDFMAGTRYIGEWETKVRELVEAVKKPRRVIIYVPNLSDLSAAGTSSKSDSNVAAALAAYLEEGSILLIGESAPEEFERGTGRIPSLARLFDKVQTVEADAMQTEKILAAVRDEEQLPIGNEVLSQLQEISSQFLNHIARPGNAVTLLRSVIENAKESKRDVTFRDVLDSLSQSSGLPAELLDDSKILRQDELKEFFEKKIVGQPEAIEAVVDLITLIKAGLTDPQKPLAVFLFIGPTGVGKTELARVLAEFIFGNSSRLKRFDMSEFATEESYLRLVGRPQANGMLTDAVHQHPFSVVLLDEIEKSHANVFDLCLQLFDAGRLTDGRGRTIDFRRTIVILTSNIGATAPGTPLGFGAASSHSSQIDKDRTFRELSRFFRPEFLNRVDRIVQFRPLSLEVAEQIARREAELVLQRAGIRRRGLVIDMDPAVISMLVREGYSPHFGARPLKRTVERMLLLPMARSIAGGAVPNHGILHLTAKDGRIEISSPRQAAPPQTEAAGGEEKAASLAEEAKQLLARFETLQAKVRPLANRKSELLRNSQDPNFYKDASRRALTFDEIYKLEQFFSFHANLSKVLTGWCEHLLRFGGTKTQDATVREKVARLTAEVEHLSFIAQCQDAQELGDAVVSLSLVEGSGSPQQGIVKLGRMYEALARRHRMTVEMAGEFFQEKQDRAYLQVTGLGAFALLKNESGLHQLNHRYRERKPRSSHEAVREDRETIRVEVLPEPKEKIPASQIKSRITPLKPARSRLVKNADMHASVFHEKSLRSIEVWTNGPKAQALERAVSLLEAELGNSTDAARTRSTAIIRQYHLGISSRVKDNRSGKSTTRVDRVFKGYLEALSL